jgi:hypothetical protein
VSPPPPVQAPTRVTKLARIISPIAQAELHQLFFGAPHFVIRSDGHYTDTPQPSVAYPWNAEVEVDKLKDYLQIQDEAWASITTLPHMPASVQMTPKVAEIYRRKHAIHFRPKCQERPSMPSMQGIEKGTIGFVAALEIPVADSIGTIFEGDPSMILRNRRKFLISRQGVRPILDSTLADKLINISMSYHGDRPDYERPSFELYTELFTQILYPPDKVKDSQDPYSLLVQIDALLDVLAIPDIWYDLGNPNERLRASHILWESSLEHESSFGEVSSHNVERNPVSTKYWLLLQILLSCELLLRLDKPPVYINQKDSSITARDQKVHISTDSSVNWSLILARTWLENVRVQRVQRASVVESIPKTGLLGSLTGTTREKSPHVESVEDLQFDGRYQVRQLAGLLHFARNIRWPNMESLTAKIATNAIKPMSDRPVTPGASKYSPELNSDSMKRQPARIEMTPTQRGLSVILYQAGWLSSSYISGFILPGEVLSHLLIATLLENDEAAIRKLGHQPCLFGGFVYASQSFWSTRCIIGRILAAQRGAQECMGWISSAVVPKGVGEGWLDIVAEPTRSGKP